MTKKTYEWRQDSGSGEISINGNIYSGTWQKEWLQTVLHIGLLNGKASIAEGMRDYLTLTLELSNYNGELDHLLSVAGPLNPTEITVKLQGEDAMKLYIRNSQNGSPFSIEVGNRWN